MIELKNVSKTYDDGSTFAVDDVSFSVERGELIGLIGESGCGKTTTLKMINRLEDATQGSIIVNGEDVRELNHAAAGVELVQIGIRQPLPQQGHSFVGHLAFLNILRIA